MRIKTETRRQAIVDIAREVFQEVGYDHASMSMIAARVGGSKATLYNYFPSKEELFAAVMHSSAEHMHCLAEARIKQIFDQLALECDIETQLLSFGEAYLAAISSPELLATRRLAQVASDRTDTGRNFYTRGPQRGTAQMSDYMARQIALGVLEPEDPWVMAEQLRALLEAEVMEKLLLGVMTSVTPAQIQATVQRAIRVFLRAYRVQC